MIVRTRRRDAGTAYKLCSLFLQYPDPDLVAARQDLAAELTRLRRTPASDALIRFSEWWTGQEPLQLEQQYVATFDLDRRCGLYLTFFTDGDKRQRGAALLRLKRLYRAGGLPLADGELPDYLPAMLEFAAAAPDGEGVVMLREHRPAIELLRASLEDRNSPYAAVLEAICLMIGKATVGERARAEHLAADGPPQELVGLEPYGGAGGALTTEPRR